MAEDVGKMTEEQLRQELLRIRQERSGIGRKRVKAARTKRIDGVQKERRRKDESEKEANAEWV